MQTKIPSKNALASFDNLPIEILLQIFSYLSPENAAKDISANKKISAGINFIWRDKLQIHFPQAYQTIQDNKESTEINYYAEFRKQYEEEYSGLTKQEKRIFSLVKEGKKGQIKKELATIKDLEGLTILDKKSKNDQMSDLVNKNKVSDVFFEKILELYTDPVNLKKDKSQILISNVKKADKKGRNILDWAVRFNQASFIPRIIWADPNLIKGRNQDGITALMRAVAWGSLEATQVLLKHIQTHLSGEERLALINQRDAYDQSSLYHACGNGHSKVVDLLLKNGADKDSVRNKIETPTALHGAILYGHLDVVNVLLEHNVAINSDIQYNWGIFRPPLEALRPLALAAKYGHTNIVKRLLDGNAEFYQPSRCWQSPWYLAAQAGHKKVLELLLNNAPNIFVRYPISPMCIAAENGHRAIVELLIEKDITALNIGTDHEKYGLNMTPLHYAVLHGQVEVIKLLLEKNANINARTGNGTTPLDLAKKLKNKEIIKLLYKAKLEEYIKRRTEDTSEYKRPPLKFFGKKYRLGYSRHQKISAANMLLTAISNDGKNLSEISKIPALHQGELCEIYKKLK
jgi:ankyrin repeat protein